MTNVIKKQVFNSIAKILDKKLDHISEDQSFTEDLECDSLDLVELVMELEKKFEIEISDTSLAKFKTLRDIIEYISRKVL